MGIMKPGSDITIVGHSIGVGFAMDTDTINESIKKTNHCITVEGGWPQHGVGAEISASISEGPAFHYLDAPVIRICGVDAPMPYAATLEAAATPQPHNIVAAVKRVLGK